MEYENLTLDDQLILMTLEQEQKDRHKSAKNRAIDKLIEKYYTRAFTLQLARGGCDIPILNEAYDFCQKEEAIEQQRQEKECEEKGYKEKTPYTFITINPKDQQISPIQMKEEVDKIITKTKWINENEYSYVIEQRSENPAEYSGVHCHLLVHTQDKPNNEIRRELKNKVKHLVDIEEVKKFDIGKNRKGPLSILPTTEPNNRLSYMMDWKKDSVKHKKQEVDKEIRKKYGIDEIYYSGELFSSLILEYKNSFNQNAELFKKENH